MRLAWLVAAKARFPVAISYSTSARAQMSVRTSASCPSICSGAMYGSVPSRVPWPVSGLSAVASADSALGAPAPSVRSLARPKSSSLTPDFVSITFWGFRSRWTIPARWAWSRAHAISMP